jgi:F-box interacting protein
LTKVIEYCKKHVEVASSKKGKPSNEDDLKVWDDDFINVDGRLNSLWNPSLRKFKILPPLDNKQHVSCTYSFGFDKFIRNYKVVAMSFFMDKCEVNVYVYTLGMDSWRRIQDFLYSGLLCGLGILMAGTVNWLPLRVLCL